MEPRRPQTSEDQEMERRLEDARRDRDRLRRELSIKAALVEHGRRLREELAALDVHLERVKAAAGRKRED